MTDKKPPYSKHKSILLVENYNEIDGFYAGDNDDARSLSIGYAQYDETDLSLKVFRHVNDQWGRQSEELPIHRVLDMCILFLRSLVEEQDKTLAQSPLSERIVPDIDGRGLKQKEIIDFCCKYKDNYLPRLEELKYLLCRINYYTILNQEKD